MDPILLVDDEADLRASLREALTEDGYVVEEADGAASALAHLSRRHFPVILTDLNMPGGPSGLELIAAVKARDPKALCVVLTGYASLSTAIEALKRGAYDFVQKPFKLDELEAVLNRALEHARLVRQLEEYQRDLEGRVAARVAELKAFQAEVLKLNSLLREGLGALDERTLALPFLDHLRTRFQVDGAVILLPGEGRVWEIAARFGARPWAAFGSLPVPEAFLEPLDWGWEEGYPEGYLVPLRHANNPLGALFLGFEARSLFQLEDPLFLFWKGQLEAGLFAVKEARLQAEREVARAREAWGANLEP